MTEKSLQYIPLHLRNSKCKYYSSDKLITLVFQYSNQFKLHYWIRKKFLMHLSISINYFFTYSNQLWICNEFKVSLYHLQTFSFSLPFSGDKSHVTVTVINSNQWSTTSSDSIFNSYSLLLNLYFSLVTVAEKLSRDSRAEASNEKLFWIISQNNLVKKYFLIVIFQV